MGTKELLESRRNEILDLAATYGAKNIRVFSSVARGEGGSGSDVDLPVDMENGKRAKPTGFGRVLARLRGATWLSC